MQNNRRFFGVVVFFTLIEVLTGAAHFALCDLHGVTSSRHAAATNYPKPSKGGYGPDFFVLWPSPSTPLVHTNIHTLSHLLKSPLPTLVIHFPGLWLRCRSRRRAPAAPPLLTAVLICLFSACPPPPPHPPPSLTSSLLFSLSV